MTDDGPGKNPITSEPRRRRVLAQLFEPEGLRALAGWRPFREGIDMIPLYGRVDAQGTPSAALLRYGPGASVPLHAHDGYEHILVLEGSQHDGDGSYERGTCVISQPGSQHTVVSTDGCTVLAIWNRPVRFLSPEARQEPSEPMQKFDIEAEPSRIACSPERTAAIFIDMQRDFLEPGGFGETLGNDVSLLQRAVGPCQKLLEGLRARGMMVIHTREGHRSDLSDAPQAKLERGEPSKRIGDVGPMGRILVRGEPGHDIIAELAPAPGEPVIDKPGKGAFYATDLHGVLKNRGIETLLVCGVTTEVCVHTTVREANDRGYRCVVVSDCCASYFPEFHELGLRMIAAQGGIFGWVSDSTRVLAAMQ